MRIYICGSHSSGKTTLARYISQTYNIPMLTEVARTVLAEMEVPLERLRTDIGLVNTYQKEILARQIKVEKQEPGPFVSDRAFDCLAYAAEHSLITPELFRTNELQEYVDWVKGGTVIFLRPNKNILTADGTRETPTWSSVLRIDGMIKLLLEIFDVSYLPIQSVSMQERVKTVGFIMSHLVRS